MNDQPTLTLRTPEGASATIFHHGAHVTSWKTPDDREQMFLSSRSEFGPGTAIRGGVPVVFPQFSGLGPLKKHGFARILVWTPMAEQSDAAVLRLEDSDETRAQWPQAFRVELHVQLRAWSLEMTLHVHNTGTTPFDFTSALHTYLAVDDAFASQVEGLQGLTYRNNPTQTEHLESAARLGFGTEIDRAYFGAGSRQVILHDGSRRVLVSQRGFDDTVVWNPAAEVGSKIPDMEPEGWLRYVCIEAAAVKPAITLAPGAEWSGTQRLDASA